MVEWPYLNPTLSSGALGTHLDCSVTTSISSTLPLLFNQADSIFMLDGVSLLRIMSQFQAFSSCFFCINVNRTVAVSRKKKNSVDDKAWRTTLLMVINNLFIIFLPPVVCWSRSLCCVNFPLVMRKWDVVHSCKYIPGRFAPFSLY